MEYIEVRSYPELPHVLGAPKVYTFRKWGSFFFLVRIPKEKRSFVKDIPATRTQHFRNLDVGDDPVHPRFLQFSSDQSTHCSTGGKKTHRGLWTLTCHSTSTLYLEKLGYVLNISRWKTQDPFLHPVFFLVCLHPTTQVSQVQFLRHALGAVVNRVRTPSCFSDFRVVLNEVCWM